MEADQLGLEGCRICGRDRGAHREANILHEFIGANEQARLVRSSHQSLDAHEGIDQGSKGTPLKVSSDAILRLALLRKGIITTDDLDEIEKELRVTGVAYHDPGRIGHS